MQELLDAVYSGFDRKILTKAEQEVNRVAVGKISSTLQVLYEGGRCEP